tara:strand:- start:263 stop:550 length:288 start_codon:yes stop_codon:yes gene_type:complete
MAQQNKIGTHKTKVFTENEITYVKYHNTRVVAFSENVIMLYTGGWFTPTTKTRMNQTSNAFGLGFQVYQKNYEWFADYNGKTYEFTGNNLILSRN